MLAPELQHLWPRLHGPPPPPRRLPPNATQMMTTTTTSEEETPPSHPGRCERTADSSFTWRSCDHHPSPLVLPTAFQLVRRAFCDRLLLPTASSNTGVVVADEEEALDSSPEAHDDDDAVAMTTALTLVGLRSGILIGDDLRAQVAVTSKRLDGATQRSAASLIGRASQLLFASAVTAPVSEPQPWLAHRRAATSSAPGRRHHHDKVRRKRQRRETAASDGKATEDDDDDDGDDNGGDEEEADVKPLGEKETAPARTAAVVGAVPAADHDPSSHVIAVCLNEDLPMAAAMAVLLEDAWSEIAMLGQGVRFL